MAALFAGYPSPFMLDAPPPARGKRIQQLLWGDFVRPLGDEAGEWIKVRGRNAEGWIRQTDLQEQRLLEVNFVDIGQGDGAFIVTPDDDFLLIDAGAGENMRRFLSWRFNLRNRPNATVPIQAAVITHSDEDHYGGFAHLFSSPKFSFQTIYHNGIVERAGEDRLGPIVDGVLTDVIDNDQTLRDRLADSAFVGTRKYPKLLKTAAQSGRVGKIEALDASERYLTGYDEESALQIEVCAPVREPNGLRSFGEIGKTKNGHSVVLRIRYRDVRILLGGDLNVASERYLLEHYTGLDPDTADAETRANLVAQARKIFGADVAKSCHHGSSDFTDLFLQVIGAAVTVISSGDDEPHAHPRPDTLGAIGKNGRGERPLIFSTELSRSTRELVPKPSNMEGRLLLTSVALEDAESSGERTRLRDDIAALKERTVAVYGMINLRTDGEKVLLAYKLERPGSGGREFDVHLLVKGDDGVLQYAGGPSGQG